MTSKSISYKLSKTEKLISITFQFEKKKEIIKNILCQNKIEYIIDSPLSPLKESVLVTIRRNYEIFYNNNAKKIMSNAKEPI